MTFRAFISVDLEREQGIEDLIIALKEADPTLKVVDPAQIHITLKFLGGTDEAKIPDIASSMNDAVQGVEPFSIKFHGTSAFPSNNSIRVVWIGLDNALQLGTMAGRLDSSLSSFGFEKEKRPFAPHLTVARAKVEAPNPVVRQVIDDNITSDLGEQKVEAIRLKKSVLTRCGPVYSTVAEVKLHE